MESEEQAWKFLEGKIDEKIPQWKDSLLEHARIVYNLSLYLAMVLSEKHQVELEVIKQGAILHDVGRFEAASTVEHGFKGGQLLRREGFPEGVARIAETHVGVGISADEAKAMDFPPGDFAPETLEERIVCYSDNLLFFDKGQKKHIIKDSPAVIERFTMELGREYGKRTEEFMKGFEDLLEPEDFSAFRKFIDEYNLKLKPLG